MIVEFFGCPGCGKTHLVKSLSGNGAYKNVTATNGIKMHIKNLGKKMLTFTPYAISVRKKILENVGVAPNSVGQYTHRTIQHQARNISMLAAGYRYMNRKMYIDEGIVHRVISLCIDHRLPRETAVNILSSIRYTWEPVKVYYLDTPPQICYESILKRGRRQGGIDFLEDEEVTVMLERYYECCEFICDRFGFQRINRDSGKEIEFENKY